MRSFEFLVRLPDPRGSMRPEFTLVNCIGRAMMNLLQVALIGSGIAHSLPASETIDARTAASRPVVFWHARVTMKPLEADHFSVVRIISGRREGARRGIGESVVARSRAPFGLGVRVRVGEHEKGRRGATYTSQTIWLDDSGLVHRTSNSGGVWWANRDRRPLLA